MQLHRGVYFCFVCPNIVDGFQRVLIELLNQDTVTGLGKDNSLDKGQNEPK